MYWYDNVLQLIDLRSFVSLWFWLLLAFCWSMTSHFVMGVPFDMISAARKNDPKAQDDIDHLARIHAARMVRFGARSGLMSVALMAGFFSLLFVLGMVYDIELAQAIFILIVPFAIQSLWVLSFARRLQTAPLQGADLNHALIRLRHQTQVLGMVTIFLAAFWGMWRVISHANVSPFGL